jgi:hypothetical protein
MFFLPQHCNASQTSNNVNPACPISICMCGGPTDPGLPRGSCLRLDDARRHYKQSRESAGRPRSFWLPVLVGNSCRHLGSGCCVGSGSPLSVNQGYHYKVSQTNCSPLRETKVRVHSGQSATPRQPTIHFDGIDESSQTLVRALA